MTVHPTPGFALWFTGLPGSGKTTLALALQRTLAERGIQAEILDSDELRARLLPDAQFTPAERDLFYHLLVVIADLLTRSGVNVLIAATGHLRRYRDEGRNLIPRFIEVYVHCPRVTCRERDPKGLWARAAAGEIQGLPGYDVPYEAPKEPEVLISTASMSVGHSVRTVTAALAARGWIEGH